MEAQSPIFEALIIIYIRVLSLSSLDKLKVKIAVDFLAVRGNSVK